MPPLQLDYLLAEFSRPIAIVANGQFPEQPQILSYLAQSKAIIACDGAIHSLKQQNIIADYVIGDGDSVGVIEKSAAKNPYIFVADQNSNDLTKAVKLLAEKYAPDSKVVIFGASGLREDHSLANIALLLQFALKFNSLVMLSDYGIFRVCPAGRSLYPSISGQQISFFAFDPSAEISCANLKWPLVATHFNFLNNGTLNQATANKLEVFTSQPILIYQAFEVRQNG